MRWPAIDTTRKVRLPTLLVLTATVLSLGFFLAENHRGLVLTPGNSFDFFAYLTAARQLREDPAADLYDFDLHQASLEEHYPGHAGGPYRYPPVFAWLVVPLTWLAPETAVTVWSVATVVFVGAALVLVALAFPSSLGGLRFALLVPLAAFFAPLREELFWGQVNALLLLLLALSSFALCRRREGAAGAALGAAIAIKLTPLFLVPFLAWKGHRRAAAAAVATAAALCALPLLVSGPGSTWSFFTEELPQLGGGGQTVVQHQAVESLWLRLFTADGSTAGWWNAPALGRALSWLSHGLVLLVTALAVRRLGGAERGPRATLVFFAALLPAQLLTTPYVWSHHYVLLLMPLAVLTLTAAERLRQGKPGLAAALALVYALAGLDWIYSGPLPVRGVDVLLASLPVFGLVLVWLVLLALLHGDGLARRLDGAFRGWRGPAGRWAAEVDARLAGDEAVGWRKAWDAPLLLGILVVAALVRVHFFIGHGLGDDFIYWADVRMILDGGYPPLDLTNQYAYRPFLLFTAAGSVALFGATNWGFVAPVFLAGLLMVALCYLLGGILGDRFVAVAASLLLAVYPLHVFDSVTFANDLLVAALGGAVILLFVHAARARGRWPARALYASAGVLLTVSYLFKVTGLVLGGVVALASLGLALRRRGPRRLDPAFFWLAFLLTFALVLLCYHLLTGDPLRHFHAEKALYAAINDGWDPGPLANTLLTFPRLMFQGQWFGGFADPVEVFPFGPHPFFFVAAALAGLVLGWRHKGFLLALVWAVLLLFVQEFSFTNLEPVLILSPRIERYLETATIPAMLVIAWALGLLHRRSRRTAQVVLAATLAAGLAGTWHYLRFATDCFRDVHRAAEILAVREPRQVYTDGTALHTVTYRLAADSRFPPPLELPADLADVPAGSSVALCGSRSFLWAPRLIRCYDVWEVPPSWQLVHVLEPGFPANPLRPAPLVIYDVLAD